MLLFDPNNPEFKPEVLLSTLLITCDSSPKRISPIFTNAFGAWKPAGR